MRKRMADKDFSISDLPSNRKEVFFDCLKVRFNILLRCGMSFFIYCIPLIACLIFKGIYIGDAQRMLANGEMTEETFAVSIRSVTALFDLGIVVSSLILAVSISGISRIIRQLAWEEHVFYKRDFFDGVKKNYKHIFKVVLVFAIIYSLSDMLLVSQISSSLLKILPELIIALLFVPVMLYSISLMNVYNIKYFITNIRKFIELMSLSYI